MRRINSEFQTQFMSEEGQKLSNRDYFGYAEMDDFACYVLADSLDDEPRSNSAKFVVDSLIRSFSEAPSMRKSKLEKYMMLAHRELLKHRGGMHLKASVILAVTDYRKIRYCYVGNSRLYLLRNDRFMIQTKDQSLTRNLLEEDKIPLDQAAVHEERNNLYSYLGERGKPELITSKKRKLEDGDILSLMTRGVWETCSDTELLDVSKDAKEPSEILNQIEDLILGKQEESRIDNYTLAITFIDKTYRPPQKRFPLKRILMIAIPVILLAGGISLGLYLRYRSIKKKEDSLANYMDSGQEYMRYDNYKKASEEYTEAKKLAGSLKRKAEAAQADQYLKLAEQIQLADDAMKGEEYQKAQNLYLKARGLSVDAGNVGKKYIDAQLNQTRVYIDVFDLIELGIQKEGYGDMEGAIASYKAARDKAASLYYGAGKEEALKKQASAEERIAKNSQQKQALEEAQRKESQAAAAKEEEAKNEELKKEKESQAAEQELENQQRTNDQKSAIDLENKGNELLADEKYESAITYYRTAQAIYIRLELPELADGINGKIKAAQTGITAKEADSSEAASEPNGIVAKPGVS